MIFKNITKFAKTLFLCLFCFLQLSLQADTDTLFLRENLKKARINDYLVTMQNKTFTLFRIDNNKSNSILIEEISIPALNFQREGGSFRAWYEKNAPKSTSRTLYEIDLTNGKIIKSYCFFKNQWLEKPSSNTFLSTLLNLHLQKIPALERKKIGRSNPPKFWQPRLQFEGQTLENILFSAWRTKWPNDKSELSGKTIEVYTPEDSELYPSYLPYWLEISGMIGKAKIRIIDSGRNLKSNIPTPSL